MLYAPKGRKEGQIVHLFVRIKKTSMADLLLRWRGERLDSLHALNLVKASLSRPTLAAVLFVKFNLKKSEDSLAQRSRQFRRQ